MIAFLLAFVGAVAFQFVVEIGFEVLMFFFPPPGGWLRNDPGLATLVVLLAASIATGLVSVLLLPNQLPWRFSTPPGISIVLAPLLVGALMHVYGAFVRARGRRASQLATFAGGAVFAFGFAWTRFFLVQPG